MCTGVAWLALPALAAIELNYYLALIAGCHAKWKLYIEYTGHVHKTYNTYPELEKTHFYGHD